MTDSPKKHRQWLPKVLLLGVSLIVAAAVAEIGLRFTVTHAPLTFQLDDRRGNAFIPNQTRWFTKEGGAFVQINSEGYRDREHTIEKNPGTLRIAVLGDSFTAGEQVGLETRFTEILERDLNKRPPEGHEVEVMNFGVMGYSTAQELLTLRKDVWKYSPDIVILAFFSGNDPVENVEALKLQPNMPYFKVEEGQLVLDDSYLTDPLGNRSWKYRLMYSLLEHSCLAQVGYRVYTDWKRPRMRKNRGNISRRAAQTETKGTAADPAGVLDQSQEGKAESEGEEGNTAETEARLAAEEEHADKVGIHRFVFAPPSVPEWEDAWNVTEAILVQMDKEVQQHGAQFMVVTISVEIQVHPDKPLRANLAKQLGQEDLFYPERRLSDLGSRHGFEVFTLAQPMQAQADRTGEFYHGFENTKLGTGHWNVAGHTLAGTLIAERLNQHLQEPWSDLLEADSVSDSD